MVDPHTGRGAWKQAAAVPKPSKASIAAQREQEENGEYEGTEEGQEEL